MFKLDTEKAKIFINEDIDLHGVFESTVLTNKLNPHWCALYHKEYEWLLEVFIEPVFAEEFEHNSLFDYIGYKGTMAHIKAIEFGYKEKIT